MSVHIEIISTKENGNQHQLRLFYFKSFGTNFISNTTKETKRLLAIKCSIQNIHQCLDEYFQESISIEVFNRRAPNLPSLPKP